VQSVSLGSDYLIVEIWTRTNKLCTLKKPINDQMKFDRCLFGDLLFIISCLTVNDSKVNTVA
jgi:hypothetical protein